MTEKKLDRSNEKFDRGREVLSKLEVVEATIKAINKGTNIVSLHVLDEISQIEVKQIVLDKLKKRHEELTLKFKEL